MEDKLKNLNISKQTGIQQNIFTVINFLNFTIAKLKYGGFKLKTQIKNAYFSVFDNHLSLLHMYRQKQTKNIYLDTDNL